MSEPIDRSVALLKAVLQWELTESQWHNVDELLANVREALKIGDLPEARRVISLVVLCGPRRVGRSINPRMDSVERNSVSSATSELINELVHSLRPNDVRTIGGAAVVADANAEEADERH